MIYFHSIYADLPSVLSGSRLAIIDPHEKFFTFQGDRTTGYTWHLHDRRYDILRLQHQIQPYTGIFGCTDQTFHLGNYQGTLFRFPLRNVPSALSETKYSSEKIKTLFKSFKTDSHRILMFLCSLECIELYQRSAHSNTPKLSFRVEIDKSCIDNVRRCRKEFTHSINPKVWMDQSVHVTFPLCVKTSDWMMEGSPETAEYWWLVTLYYAGGQASAEIQHLHSDPNLSLLPTVGCAMELKQRENKDIEDDDGIEAPSGHVFCFLPLPVEQKSSTGLPVHINGYFSISQNRRHLKWPSLGQNPTSDKSVSWNQCLLKEVIHKAYIQLVKTAIQMNISKNEHVSKLDIYQALPDIVGVNEKWQPILRPLYEGIFQLPVIHTMNNAGSWVSPKDAIFNCLKEKAPLESLLVNILLSTGHDVSKVPKHILHALGAYSTVSPEVISPSLIRNVLKIHPESYVELTLEDKLLLLQYVLMDHDYNDLDGIALLPLHNGDFVAFQGRGSPEIYLPSEEHPADLLPGLGCHLVATVSNSSIEKAFKKICDEGINVNNFDG